MKKVLALIIAIGLLSFGAMAFAHGGGSGSGWGGMMGGGPGYGGHGGYGMMGGGYGMMGGGPGYGGHGGYGMMGGGPGYGGGGCGGPGGGYGKAVDPEKQEAFFKDTLKLRKQLHEKMFELREAYFAGDEKKVEKLGKEAEALQEKLFEAAKEHGIARGEGSGGESGGYGRGRGGHMGQGYGGHMGGWR
jgi:hypothetical protein